MRFVTLFAVVALTLVACSGSTADRAPAEPAFSPASASDLEACGVDATERTQLLALSINEFDQDLAGGWRPIAERPGCEVAAATLLDAYIAQNGIEPDGGVMHWHVGQLLAFSGDNEAAVPWLEMSRDADTARTDPAWNLYVDGTVAFLTQDQAALQAAIDSLAAVEVPEAEKALRRQFLEDNPDIVVPDGFVDQPPNLRALVGLMACFGRPYSVAYSCEP